MVGSLICSVVAADPRGEDVSFSIVTGNDLGAFQIDSVTGEISVENSDPFGFEVTPLLEIAIEVSGGVLSKVGAVTV